MEQISAPPKRDLEAIRLWQFSCPTCPNYVLGNINQCIEGHFFCTNCFQEDKCSLCGLWTLPGRTTMLEDVRNTVNFPCKYANRGCQWRGLSVRVTDHEDRCSHSETSCPLSHIGCGWNGKEAEVVQHCYDCHPDDTYATMSHSFKVEDFRNLENKKVFVLFNASLFLFRFNWELDRETDTFVVAIYFLGTPPLHLMFDYQISFSSKPNPSYNDICIKVQGPIHKLEDNRFAFITNKSTRLSLEQLCSVCDDEGSLHYTVDIFCSRYF